MSSYDLNIWDHLGYITEYEQEGWRITVHADPGILEPYGSGEILCHLDLTKEESDALTLGVAPEDGGVYAPDSDFWLDLDTFVLLFAHRIPSRVGAFFASLYEGKEEEKSELLSLWQELSANQG